jgi:hypothetical protein
VTGAGVPVIFSMQDRPTTTSGVPAMLKIAEQVKWGLMGLVISMLVLGWVLNRFIRRCNAYPIRREIPIAPGAPS